jgi:hypothetical protein
MSIIKKEKRVEELDSYDKRYAISYDGYVQEYLNPIIVEEQMIIDDSEQFKNLKQAYLTRLKIFHKMEITTNTTHLKKLDALYEKNEFYIQSSYNFNEDSKFHKFWNAPNCTCNKEKNNFLYPNGDYHIDVNCPVHSHRLY